MDEPAIYMKTKNCAKCGATFQHKSNANRPYCSSCLSGYEKDRYSQGKNRAPAEYKRNAHYQRTYGVTLAEYNQMFAQQNGVCAVCGNVETKQNTRTGQIHNLLVDHDHQTGKIRGLLCNSCNVTLGLMEDDPTRLMALIQYLEKHKIDGSI